MASLIGKTLGKYRLVARLGRGGMAEVYKAFQPGMNRYVSVKVLHTHMVDDKSFVGRFEREALAVGKLRHPNIVQAFDFDREGDLYFLAMEFIDGPTLKEELEARQTTGKLYTLKEIARIFSALCSAIDYAHTHGMIHRDLKPANVMINPEGQVVLTDFGIARIMSSTTYTQTGVLSGTPYYMSPEQGQGHHGDERSDIYSLGVMLYEIVTGAVPYNADTPLMVIMKHINEPVPPPSRVVPNLPRAVEQIILKAMSKKPEDRYQRAGELAAALRGATGLTSEEIYLPLTTIAPRPQIKEIDHSTGVFPPKEKTFPVDRQPAGGTQVAPPTRATEVQAAPVRRQTPWLPFLIGGAILILLLLIGLLAGALWLTRPEKTTPTTMAVAAAASTIGATPASVPATATAVALANITATAQAEATTAASSPPTQTAQAATVQVQAAAATQTAEARVMAEVESALAGTATAAAKQAAEATAITEQNLATQTAIVLATSQAAAVQVEATNQAAATQTAAVEAAQTAAAQASQLAEIEAAQTAEARTQAKIGVFNDFEFASTWKRGDEPNGVFERTTAQAHQGSYSGQLSYQFSTAGNDYVVFLWSQLLGGEPNQITAWVYGDGRGHFLNVWLKDSQGETWQFSFGQVKHTGWQQMTAFISPNQPWPAGHVDGPSNGGVDYPLRFQGLVLDDGGDDFSGNGIIYIDDLASGEGTLPSPPTPAPAFAPASPITFNAGRSTLGAGECTLLSWSVENVSAVYLNGEGVPGQYSRQVCPGATTTYTLLIILRDGSTTSKSVTITVQ